MKNFNRLPTSKIRLGTALMLSTLAFASSGCGEEVFGDSDNNKTRTEPKAVTTNNDDQPHVKGQPDTSMTFYPDGTALSKTVFDPNAPRHTTTNTHYSCPGQGPNLQVVSIESAQLIPNSFICDDGRVTQADFLSPKADPTH